jgi:hypothetical protein
MAYELIAVLDRRGNILTTGNEQIATVSAVLTVGFSHAGYPSGNGT